MNHKDQNVTNEPTKVRLLNIPAYLAHWARQTPDAEALLVLGPVPRSYTYRELVNMVTAQTVRLAGMGVGPEDRVAVLVNSDERLIITMLATGSLGAATLPISVNSLPCRDVLIRFSQIRRLKAVALSGRFRRLMSETLASQPISTLLDLDGPVLDCATDEERNEWETLVGGRSGDLPFYANHTSGSSSASPKLIEATHSELLANTYSCLEHFGGDTKLRWLAAFVYHQHEFFLRPIVAGGTTILVPIHQGETDLASECAAGRVTHLLTNPPRAEALAASPAIELARLRGQLRSIEVGGGLLGDEVARRLASKTGAHVFRAYGSTETSGVAMASAPAGSPGDDGLRPLPGYKASVVDENRLPVQMGNSGELVLAGPAVAVSYLVPPPGEVRLENRHFLTKDLAVASADGSIKVLGRMDAALKVLGTRISLESIEQALRQGFGRHAKLVQCLELQPDNYFSQRLGTGLIALVVPATGMTDIGRQRRMIHQSLRRARLAAFLTCPSYFVFLRPDEVRQEGGKLIRRHARERFPMTLADWCPADRARLVPAPVLFGDVLRTLWWLRQESRALRHPFWLVCRELVQMVRRLFRGEEPSYVRA